MASETPESAGKYIVTKTMKIVLAAAWVAIKVKQMVVAVVVVIPPLTHMPMQPTRPLHNG
jgi:hypothetical protein